MIQQEKGNVLTASLHYTGSPIDRADALRRDVEQIKSLWQQPDTIFLPVFELKNLVKVKASRAVLMRRETSDAPIPDQQQCTFLGLVKGNAIFSFTCDESVATEWESIDEDYQFQDLRQVGPLLPHDEASMLAFSRGISHWQQLNRFCAACGSSATLKMAGHMLTCDSSACARSWFPRTDPAVIMLIERSDASGKRHCLLGRSPQWPEHVYSTLAGFVETGESLEQAVIREVHEEANIVVNNVRYVASQPWPFPQSLMVGFVGTATTEEIKIDTTELADARWFEVGEIATFGDWGDDSAGPKLPRKDSIARYLIDQWAASETA